MKTTSILWSVAVVLAFVGGIAVSAQVASPWSWPATQDAVRADPDHHRVLFEDDNVRILEVTVPPGATEKTHTHQWSSVFVVDTSPKFSVHWLCSGKTYCGDTEVVTIDRPKSGTPMPYMMRLNPEGPHYVVSEDTIPLHGYKIEYKKLSLTTSAPL